MCAQQAEKILDAVRTQQSSTADQRQHQDVDVMANTDDHQMRVGTANGSNNLFLEDILDFPGFSSSDWSFDAVNLENIEFWS